MPQPEHGEGKKRSGSGEIKLNYQGRTSLSKEGKSSAGKEEEKRLK